MYICKISWGALVAVHVAFNSGASNFATDSASCDTEFCTESTSHNAGPSKFCSLSGVFCSLSLSPSLSLHIHIYIYMLDIYIYIDIYIYLHTYM